MSRGIVLLSGGLDSVVSLAVGKEKYGISLAITFDYGQKSVQYEIEASKNICKYYDIEHRIIKLDWLKAITHTALVSEDSEFEDTSSSVWVPNRNGLFLNIAGSYCDGENFDYILIGANREEAETFSDNTQSFIDSINNEFVYSTQKHPKVVAPLINLNKNAIVSIALSEDVPLHLIYSCYSNKEKHCGVCQSCKKLKSALLANNDSYYIRKLF